MYNFGDEMCGERDHLRNEVTVAGCIGGGHHFVGLRLLSWSLWMGSRPSQAFDVFMSLISC